MKYKKERRGGCALKNYPTLVFRGSELNVIIRKIKSRTARTVLNGNNYRAYSDGGYTYSNKGFSGNTMRSGWGLNN